MTKLTYVDRVLARLNITDNQKIKSFFEKNEKYHLKAIKDREEKIEDLREQLAEKEEALASIIESPDMGRIKTNDAQRSYLEEFNAAVTRGMQEVEFVKASIKEHEGYIADLKARWAEIESK